MLLEIMLKHVQVHTSIMERQRVFTRGNFTLDFALLVKMVTNTSKQRPKSATDYVTTHSSRHKKLSSITSAKLLTEHESKELFRQYCSPGGPLSRQNGESMKQYVSRRRRCLTLLVQMDPVFHLSEGHRSDMPLDLSGLTREERVVVQASINDERDFDRNAEALIIQHPRIHLRESQRQTKGKGKDGSKRGDTSNTRWFR